MKSSQKLFAAGIYQQLPEVEGRHGGSVRASQPAAMGSNLDTPEIFWLEISDAEFRFRFFVTPDQPDFETNFASAVEFTSVSINQVDKEEKERGSGQMVSISSRR